MVWTFGKRRKAAKAAREDRFWAQLATLPAAEADALLLALVARHEQRHTVWRECLPWLIGLALAGTALVLVLLQ